MGPIDYNGADNHSQNSYSEFPRSLLVIRLRKWNQAELFPLPTLTLSPALCFPPETEKEVSLVLSKPNFPISPASIFRIIPSCCHAHLLPLSSEEHFFTHLLSCGHYYFMSLFFSI